MNNISIEQTCSTAGEGEYCNTDETIVLKNVDAEINSLYQNPSLDPSETIITPIVRLEPFGS